MIHRREADCGQRGAASVLVNDDVNVGVFVRVGVVVILVHVVLVARRVRLVAARTALRLRVVVLALKRILVP